jgi:hypothetical protein
MKKHQEHFGRRFYKLKRDGYWYSTDSPRVYAHRWVWMNIHGKIPKGCHIHHKDKDRSNNSIENLELMNASCHLKLHMTPERRERHRISFSKIRDLAKLWHSSDEGRAWHKYHAIKCKLGKWEPRKHSCSQCHNEFFSTKRSNTKFCSNKCKSKWRRYTGLDDISKTCGRCGTVFQNSKYSKQKFCSRMCLKGVKAAKAEQALELRKKGLTYDQIGKLLSLNRQEASNLIKELSKDYPIPYRNSRKLPH